MPERPTSASESALWRKVAKHAATTGRGLIERVLMLVNTLKDPDTPLWARGTILSALGYFLSPLDIIPDFIPVVGYADDTLALIAAVAAVAIHIKKEHREDAKLKLERWFGKPDSTPPPPRDP